MKKLVIFLFLSCCIAKTRADNFAFKSKIDSVSQTGYYKILVSPDIISVSKSDYSDIRIFDSGNNEIPYILSQEESATGRTGFRAYNIIENSYLPKQAITRIVVGNSARNSISRLVLIVRNTAVEKEITLKGSDDQRNWYIIARSFPEVTWSATDETTQTMTLDFPKSNYRFFEITMNDKKKDPLQVMKIGFYDSEIAKGVYSQIPYPVIKQSDSTNTKESYLSVRFNRPYEISKLVLHFDGPEFYFRNCLVGHYVTVNNKSVFEEIGHFIISSGNQPVWEFNKVKTDGLIIIVQNSDNAPLQLRSAKAFQLNKYLIAKLKAGETYYLFAGRKNLMAPDYDLKYFADSIPTSIATVKTRGLTKIDQQAQTKKTPFFNQTLLWMVLVVVILLLAWLSVKLTKEMARRTS